MNKQVFFSAVKKTLFGGKLTQSQVSGMDSILDSFELNGVTDNRYRAYMLATVYHECAKKMQPIEEYGKGRKHDYGKRLKMSRKPYSDTTAIFYGRGFVQLTWYENYEKAGKYCGVNLLQYPELSLNPLFASKILIGGMTDGWFTGKKLSDYFTEDKTDWKNARRIINGMDKADLIAGYALKFFDALKDANDN